MTVADGQAMSAPGHVPVDRVIDIDRYGMGAANLFEVL